MQYIIEGNAECKVGLGCVPNLLGGEINEVPGRDCVSQSNGAGSDLEDRICGIRVKDIVEWAVQAVIPSFVELMTKLIHLNPEAELQDTVGVETAEGATSAESSGITASGSSEAAISISGDSSNLTLGGSTIGAVESFEIEVRKKVSIGLDSGAELTVWPPSLIPEVKTKPSKDSVAGVKYYGPGDVQGPSLIDEG